MKVPTARRLPSGNWFVRLRLGGESIPITAPTEKECTRRAAKIKADYLTGQRQTDHFGPGMSLKDAYTEYIDSKRAVLSPSTIAGYKRLQDHSFQGIMSQPLRKLTQRAIQSEVSAMVESGKSPKSVSNAVGLLSAVLKMHYPEFHFHVTLPPRKHIERIEPKESDITAIFKAVKGKSVELPTLLAMWMGLRMSEILGLTWDCIDGDTMHIMQAKVDEGVKGTKTFNSDRYLHIPPYIKQLIDQRPHTSDFIIPVTRGAIYDAFQKYTKRADIQHYRFHDLRHLNTTVQLLLGLDNKTIIKRNGWSTDAMIKTVYGHTSAERVDLATEVIDDFFSSTILKNVNENGNETP